MITLSNKSLKGSLNESEHFESVYQSARYKEWDRYYETTSELEKILINQFRDFRITPKLIGSSATGTMRKFKPDADYAVAFDTPISNLEFERRILASPLDIYDVNENRKHNYMKISGLYEGINFVLVPLENPMGNIKTYPQEAFYHPEFINERKKSNHSKTVILMKEFFEQLGVYSEVKGIGCELMSLYFGGFHETISSLVGCDYLRINMSGSADSSSYDNLVIDYPILGKRSLTNGVTSEMYSRIKDFARSVLEKPELIEVR